MVKLEECISKTFIQGMASMRDTIILIALHKAEC